MEIISPENSFLDFNYFEDTTCLNEDIIPLPKCDNLAIKAQIEIDSDEDITIDTPLYIAISDTTCNVILDEDIQITPICSKYKFVTTIEDVVIDETSPYNLCNPDADEPTETIEFLTNPFDEITSTDLEFDLELSPIGNQLQLYINNNVYILGWNSSPLMPEMVVSQQDNVYFVLLSTFTPSGDAGKINQLKVFLQDVLDVNEGTTTTVSSNTFTIEDVPTGSYLNNYAFIENINSVTASTNVGEFIYWNNNQLIYYQSNESAGTPLYKFENTGMQLDDSYEFRIYYTSFYNDIEGEITFDDGTNPPTTVLVNFDEYDGYIVVNYEATATSTHTITIDITNVGTHKTGLSINKIERYNSILFNVTQNISGNIPVGNYYKPELIALISELIGQDFDCEFTSCCEIPEIEFIAVIQADDEFDYHYKLTQHWQKGFINYPETSIYDISENCFTYAVLDANKEVIACSNVFQKQNDCCYITKIEYSNNEDAFGFSYPTGVTNMIELPFFVHSPQHLVKEKIYKQTNGTYKRLSAEIEKEYECETDYFAEFQHDKLITALKHDTVIVTSNRLGFTDTVTQQGDYKMDWNSKIEFTAKAEFKIRKYFNGKNNNCGTSCN